MQETDPSFSQAVTETERENLARCVHDLGQPLTAIKLLISRMEKSPDGHAALLPEVSALINEMQVEVRKLLNSLQPKPDDIHLPKAPATGRKTKATVPQVKNSRRV